MESTVSLNQEFFSAFTACLTVSTSSESLTFAYLKDSPELVWAFQIQLVNSPMDKTWHRKDSQTIVKISEHMKKAMPYLPVDISSFNEKPPPQLHENQSWHPHALVSLSCLYVCSRALAHAERLVHLSRPERQACGQYVLRKDKLSARCKTHFKAIQGSPAVFGKQAWGNLTSFVERRSPQP